MSHGSNTADICGAGGACSDRELTALGQVVLCWDLTSDALGWSNGALELLEVADADLLRTGRQFRDCIEEDARAVREARIKDLIRDGTSMEIEYRFLAPGAPAPIWLEERMVWRPGPGENGSLVSLLRPVTERKQREARLVYLSSSDEVTGLMNRARLRERLGHTLAYAFRYKAEFAYFKIAIDSLNQVNEAYGFDIADEVIVAVGQRLERALRAGDVLGRVGGAKFGVILCDCTERDMAAAAERLLRVIRESVVETRAGPVSVTVSIGGVALPGQARTTHDAMSFAEEALDQAKQSGRDTFFAYHPSFKVQSNRKRNIAVANRVLRALREDRVQLAYQPIVDSISGETRFHECLVRLGEEDGTHIPAADFIPVAEKLGLVRLIDRRVAELAISALHQVPELAVSINVSGMTATDVNWLRSFMDLVRGHGDVAHRLIVEITETIAIHDIEDSLRFVSTLRDLGCGVAIDDFGAGYTSFHNLKSVPVDMVKIDGSFICGIHKSPDNRVFVKALMDLARTFKLRTVAEMVGEREEADLLRDMGVDLLQGFLFGRPEIGIPGTAAGASSLPRAGRTGA